MITVNVQGVQVIRDTELSHYYGMDLHAAAEIIGGLKYVVDDAEDENFGWGYENEYMLLTVGIHNDVSNIWLYNKPSEYTLVGLRIGMSRSEAKVLLSGYYNYHDEYPWYDDDIEPYWHYSIKRRYEHNYWVPEIDLFVSFDDNDRIEAVHYGLES